MNAKLSSSFWIVFEEFQNFPECSPRRFTQNICSPNRFYLTFANDDSWNFDKTLKYNIKKTNKTKTKTFLYKYLVFPLFWLTLISFFFNYLNLFLSTANKCTMKIMIIIIINVTNFLERHFRGISINIFRN